MRISVTPNKFKNGKLNFKMVAAVDASIVDFVSGTAAGISQVLVGHPFDTIKVHTCRID